MCGIFGCYGFEDKQLLSRMSKILQHRGPDGSGFFLDKNICLGNNRLAIIDSENCKQLIHNEDECIWITYKGEIYNGSELKKDLEERGHRFYTNTDTEVIIHSYEEYGTECLNRFNGMFAFALWDGNKKQLFLARDNFGIKPLYYYMKDGKFLFSSEIKGILKHREISPEVNINSLNSYIALRYSSGKETLFKDIFKLLPGSFLIIKGTKSELKRYWSPESELKNKQISVSPSEIERYLNQAVIDRLASDKPMGIFLSGGIDSGLILDTIYRKAPESLNRITAFTIGVENHKESKEEMKYAELVSKNYNTRHSSTLIDSTIISDLPYITYSLDEPVATPTTMLTYKLAKKASKICPVILTGDGSDEIFGNYFQ